MEDDRIKCHTVRDKAGRLATLTSNVEDNLQFHEYTELVRIGLYIIIQVITA